MSTSTPHTAAYILDVDTMILTLQCIHSICSAFMFIKSFYWWRACSRSPLGLWRHKKNKANGPINLLLLHSCNLPAYIIWLDKVFKCLYSVLNNDNQICLFLVQLLNNYIYYFDVLILKIIFKK
jgi:hypothetical protein